MAANSVIEQKPLFQQLPVGQEVIYVVSNTTAVADELKVKFIANVHISSTTPANPNTSADLVGTFKTTPNNAGVGIFDFRNIIENYVKADNMAADGSSYKTTTTSSTSRHPLQLIDKFSLNDNVLRYLVIKFEVEYLGADDGVNPVDPNIVRTQVGTDATSLPYMVFNGYLKYTDHLSLGSSVTNANDFGYSLVNFYASSTGKKFLTNAPAIQYANIDDYGTMSYFAPDIAIAANVHQIKFTYYDSTGSAIGTADTVLRDSSTGAYNAYDASANRQIMHFGCYPANLRNWSTNFNALVTAGTIQGGYYTIEAQNASNAGMTQLYTINVNCPEGKGFKSIRLCWLNQWGVWDYYTFTKKSIKSISTKGSTYQQLQGTWYESAYRIDSFRGGKKSFRVNATEKITMNTGFLVEDENVIFEELINSPEVYQLEGFQTDTFSALNQYVTPVRLTTSSFTKKTIANDKLIQYTFEIEKSKTLRTQSI